MGLSQSPDPHPCGREGQVPSDLACVGSRPRAISDRWSVGLCLALDQLDTSAIRGVDFRDRSDGSRATNRRGSTDEARTKALQRGQAAERGQRARGKGKPEADFLLGDRPHPRDSRDDPAGISSGRIRTHPVQCEQIAPRRIMRRPSTDSPSRRASWRTFGS